MNFDEILLMAKHNVETNSSLPMFVSQEMPYCDVETCLYYQTTTVLIKTSLIQLIE